jgi:hypothetical protein
MYFTGIGDEAANTIDGQIAAIKELGWNQIEMRGVEVAGFPKGNFHDIPDKAFDIAVEKLNAADVKVCCFGSTIGNWGKENRRSRMNNRSRKPNAVSRGCNASARNSCGS